MTLFRFLVDEESEYIIHYSSLVGCYVKSLPRDSLSDIPENGPLRFTVGFHCPFVREDPLVLAHFNQIASTHSVGDKEIPIYDDSIGMVSGEWCNMPYVVSYILPIIISCLVRQIDKINIIENYLKKEENEIIIIENPEAHLHPSAQSKLGYFLAKTSKYIQIIIETHSEHIINGIRLATLDNDVDNNSISINFFSPNKKSFEPNIQNIKIDKFSDLTDWPIGFFDQQEADIRAIFEYRRKNRK